MSVEKRSALMSRIRSTNTGPEREMAILLAEQGLLFETHAADLPGRPDFVFRKNRLAVFLDGDFWHGWRFPLWQHKLAPKWQTKIATTRGGTNGTFDGFVDAVGQFFEFGNMRWKMMRAGVSRILAQLLPLTEEVSGR